VPSISRDAVTVKQLTCFPRKLLVTTKERVFRSARTHSAQLAQL